MHQQVCDNKGRKQSRRLSYPLLIIYYVLLPRGRCVRD